MVEAFFIAPILGEEADHLLAASDEYMASLYPCLLYTSPSPRDLSTSRMPSSA